MADVWDGIAAVGRNYADSPEDDPTFDGNRSNAIISWFYPTKDWEGMQGDVLEEFTERTREGHLQWVIFPVGTG